jgi:ferredoxin
VSGRRGGDAPGQVVGQVVGQDPGRVVADLERCVGSGMCVLTTPSVFDQDDEDGTVRLRTERPPSDVAASVRRAVDLCPARALSLRAD